MFAMSAIQNLNLLFGLLGVLIQITFLWELAILVVRKEAVELLDSEWKRPKPLKNELN
jgi:hypothetical protein